MSLNTAHTDGGVLIHAGEYILLHSDGVSIDFSGQDNPLFKGTKQGRIYLTSHRMIFNSKKPADQLQSFSAPFIAMSDVELEQPVFGANYIKGKVRAQPNGHFVGEVKFKLHFKSGGAIEYGQALLRAASTAQSNYHRAGYGDDPPPYTPSGSWHEAPPPAYQPPPGYYGWLPTHDAFSGPAPNTVFVSDNPPPYPGIGPPAYSPGQQPAPAYSGQQPAPAYSPGQQPAPPYSPGQQPYGGNANGPPQYQQAGTNNDGASWMGFSAPPAQPTNAGFGQPNGGQQPPPYGAPTGPGQGGWQPTQAGGYNPAYNPAYNPNYPPGGPQHGHGFSCPPAATPGGGFSYPPPGGAPGGAAASTGGYSKEAEAMASGSNTFYHQAGNNARPSDMPPSYDDLPPNYSIPDKKTQ